MTSLTTTDQSINTPHPKRVLYGGVDTHKDTHHVAIVDEIGRSVADKEFPATGAGYRQIVVFLHGYGPIDAVGVEGTGSYGAGLTRVLTDVGMTVIEVMRTNRQFRRLKGKSDPLDARQAALTVLAGRGLATPKQRDGFAESLRILLAERSSAVKARSATLNQIHSLLINSDDAVRQDYRRYAGDKLVQSLAHTRPSTGHTPAQIARQSLKRLATRHLAFSEDITAIDLQLQLLVRQINPALLAAVGIGPVVAATLLTTIGDNPERITSKAQFAALCGVAPIPASSGQRVRHRLSRGGDRRANHAIHRVVLVRMRHSEPRTMEYFARRSAEGLSDRDIIRCLKRHIANEVYALLTHPETAMPSGPLMRQRRQALNAPIANVAQALGVPYQRLRRLEIGQRADAELELVYTSWLANAEQKMALNRDHESARSAA